MANEWPVRLVTLQGITFPATLTSTSGGLSLSIVVDWCILFPLERLIVRATVPSERVVSLNQTGHIFPPERLQGVSNGAPLPQFCDTLPDARPVILAGTGQTIKPSALQAMPQQAFR